MLFLATRASVASNHCHDEINFALDHAVPVLTVYLEDTELTPSLRLRLSSHRGVIGTGLDATERAARVSGALSRLLDGGHGDSFGTQPEPNARRMRWPLLTAVLLIAGAGLIYGLGIFRTAATNPANVEDRIPPMEPSIAVLPFQELGGSEASAYFAAGIHEDVLTQLSMQQDFVVTARGSTLAFASDRPPSEEIGRALDVRYLL